MSDALPLPPRPNVEQYEKLAKDLQSACKSGDADLIREWAGRWVETLSRLRAEAITPDMRKEMHGDMDRVERVWQETRKSNELVARCTLTGTQFFIARCHGFTSWPKFVEHLEALNILNSPVSMFEIAVDAVVTGDVATLSNLLRNNPELARARSTREHRSTLLHYVAANGVEDFRQKTPKNIVEIAKLLLDAGADVNAGSEAYGGRSATLGLVSTSWPPQEAGVQLPLMELLIERGAIIDDPEGATAVTDSLHNGRGQAAELFAKHGAQLNLEGAAGVGRLDVVRSFFGDDGSLRPPATPRQMKDGFAWACEFGRTAVVDFLLQKGVEVGEKLPHNGQTGLHWAALGGHVSTVRLLLERVAPVDVKDESFGGTPLEWALYGWGSSSPVTDSEHYYEVVASLVRANAKLNSMWFEGDDEDRIRTIKKLEADYRMQAALRGEIIR